MFRKIRRFSGRDALAHNIRGFRSRQPELPDIVGGFPVKEPSKIIRRNAARRIAASASIDQSRRNGSRTVSTKTTRVQPTLPKHVRVPENRTLRLTPEVT